MPAGVCDTPWLPVHVLAVPAVPPPTEASWQSCVPLLLDLFPLKVLPEVSLSARRPSNTLLVVVLLSTSTPLAVPRAKPRSFRYSVFSCTVTPPVTSNTRMPVPSLSSGLSEGGGGPTPL